jgi:hypothetical protein
MPDDSARLVPPFRLGNRQPFIEEGARSLTVESQPESVLFRKFGNLPFSTLIVYWPDALQVRLMNSGVPPFAVHPAFD